MRRVRIKAPRARPRCATRSPIVSEFTRLQKAALVDATAASQRAEAARHDAVAARRRDRAAFRQRLDAAEAEAASLNARRRDDDAERAA